MKNNFLILLTLYFWIGSFSLAYSKESGNDYPQFYVGARVDATWFIGGMVLEKDSPVFSTGINLHTGIIFNDAWSLRNNIWASLITLYDDSYNLVTVGQDIVYTFPEVLQRTRPYIGLGVDVVSVSNVNSDWNVGLGADILAGFNYQLNKDFDLFAESQYMLVTNGGTLTGVLQAGLGLKAYLR